MKTILDFFNTTDFSGGYREYRVIKNSDLILLNYHIKEDEQIVGGVLKCR